MKQGFTLLELSIVIAIIGLIIGGITVGADMIRSAQLNTVISDFGKYKDAVETFKLKYRSIPGDMADAIDYWGAADADPATCYSTASTGKTTCNGTGNGIVSRATNVSYERYRFWQHLANAELIQGNFTGVSGSLGVFHSVVGENVPGSAVGNNIGWTPYNQTSPYAGNGSYFASDYERFLIFGTALEHGTSGTTGVALTPAEAISIDRKIDDSKPAKGKIKAIRWSSCTDAANNTDLEADYLLSSDTAACALAFMEIY